MRARYSAGRQDHRADRPGHARAGLAIVGYSFIQFAQTDSPGQAKALGSALASLRDQPTLFTAVAAGLILFGVFSLLMARYRIVPAIDVVDAAKGGARAAVR